MCCNQDTDAAALAALYADSEGQLAELLERLEAETPKLDELLADLDNQSKLSEVLARLEGDCCPYCGRPMEQGQPITLARTKRVRSAARSSPKHPQSYPIRAAKTGQK